MSAGAEAASAGVLDDLNQLFRPEDPLALFTDALFYDWDLGRFLDGRVDSYEQYFNNIGRADGETYGAAAVSAAPTGIGADAFFTARDGLSALGYDFLNFKFPADTSREGDIQHSPSPAQYSSTTTTGFTADHAPTSNAQVQPQQPQEAMATQLSPTTTNYASSSSASPPPLHQQHTQLSAADAHILSIQEAARVAAEEDKRRRNTAASARFRIKKKQRDQAIEKAAKEMAERVEALEKKISTLELENRWLRNLLVEKNNAMVEAERSRRGV